MTLASPIAGENERGWDIEAVGVHKRYGAVVALENADFRARYGEVHALLGENGAGKSTLVRMLTGAARPDAGDLRLDGEVLHLHSNRDGIELGIDAVYQELSLIRDLSVAENIQLGREPTRAGFTNRRAGRRYVRKLFSELGLDSIDPSATVGSLPLAQQQIVEIVKVLARKPRVLVLDEATSSLPRQDVLWLVEIVRRLVADGAAVFMISHRLGEAYELADRCTVFRSGQSVATGLMSEFSEEELIQLMIGRELAEGGMRVPKPPQDEVVFETRSLSLGTRFHSVDLTVRKGEVLGIGGLQGQGQAELLLALYGWHHPQGEVLLHGEPVHIDSPRAAIKAGIAYVPEDRRTQGLLLDHSIRENVTLAALDRIQRAGGWLPARAEHDFARGVADRFRIRADSLEREVRALSGGNQQKVLIGKCLSDEIQVLLLADVTRGIDVGAKSEFYDLLHELAERGIAVIWASSDIGELTSLCHRVAIMFDRSIRVTLESVDISEENVVRAALSGDVNVNGEEGADAYAPTASVPGSSRSADQAGDSLLTMVRRTANASVVIPVVLFLSLLVTLVLLAGDAFSLTLLLSMLETTTPLLLVGMGQTLVALTGGIDLAVGGVMSVCATLLVTQMATDSHIAMWLPLILLVGLAGGAINGVLIHTTKIQSFIVTLASWSVFSGIALLILPTEGGTVAPGLSSALMGNIGGVPKSVWILVVLLVGFQLLRRTPFGTAVYALGGNEEAARLNGLRIARTKILVYALSGLFAALAAVFYVGAVALSASPVSGDPFILQSVAAVVIGGTSLFGGKGGYFGTVLGAMSLTVIGSIVFFSQVQSYFGQLLQGVLLVGAVLLYSIVDTAVRRRSLTHRG